MDLPSVPSHGAAVEIGFILLPGFALMSYAAASEPLRAANMLAGRTVYRVRCFGEAAEVAASGQAVVRTEPLPTNDEGLAAVFVCAGGDPSAWHRPAVHQCLRRLAHDGVRIGGISGGPYVLAAAGLLAGRRFTIHWEHAPALVEAYPDAVPEQTRYVIDRDRLTCGGGIAPIDMMHGLIAERMGFAFARRVTDWFLHTELASGEGPQRASLAERYGIHHPALVAALAKMEATVEAPLSRDRVARLAGVSPRHLDRLFAELGGMTFRDAYRRIRLDAADKLVRQSTLSISEIAFATGFANPGHFARAYRAQFGRTPRTARRQPRQLASIGELTS